MTGVEALRSTVDALEGAGARYMLTGSFASNAYGIPRSTKDADVIVDFKAADLSMIVSRLAPGIQLQEQMMFETITGTTRHILEVEDSAFKIELFHINPDPFAEERFERRLQVDYPELERRVWLPTPEDVVVQKLRWGRDKDLGDVTDVLFVSGDYLDYSYIEKWCREHGTLELLQSIRSKLPPGSDTPE